MLSMSRAYWRTRFGGPGFHGQVPEAVSGDRGVLRTWNGGIVNAIDLKVLEKLSCSALATSHQRRQVMDENLTPTRIGEGLNRSSTWRWWHASNFHGALPASTPARRRQGGAGALITALGSEALLLSEWWPAVPSAPSPLNLKAVPEERAEIVHSKAWLLDEVFWGANSCWGGVEFPEKGLVTISAQPPPGSTT